MFSFSAYGVSAGQKLRQQIASGTVYAIGVEGVESANVALKYGYETLFLSGSWVTKVVHDKPDIGYYTAEDALNRSRAIFQQHPNAVLIADVDGGFGKASDATDARRNIEVAVKAAVALEAAGVAGIVIDDQNPTNRKAEVDPGKEVIRASSMQTMIQEIRKAVSSEFVIIGRTAVEQTGESLQRADMLRKAGSDLVIVESINSSSSDLEQLGRRQQVPLTTIQLDKGEAMPWTQTDHKKMGVNVVLLANALRKRWEQKGAGMDQYAAKLGLSLFGCHLGLKRAQNALTK